MTQGKMWPHGDSIREGSVKLGEVGRGFKRGLRVPSSRHAPSLATTERKRHGVTARGDCQALGADGVRVRESPRKTHP